MEVWRADLRKIVEKGLVGKDSGTKARQRPISGQKEFCSTKGSRASPPGSIKTAAAEQPEHRCQPTPSPQCIGWSGSSRSAAFIARQSYPCDFFPSGSSSGSPPRWAQAVAVALVSRVIPEKSHSSALALRRRINAADTQDVQRFYSVAFVFREIAMRSLSFFD